MPLRAAAPDDVSTIVALARRLFVEDSGRRDRHADVDWPTSGEGREHYTRLVAAPSSCVLLAEAPDVPDPVGFLAGELRPRSGLRPDVTVADLQVMYVLPDHRSRGTGHALAEAFRRWAAGRGADVASVTTSAANAGARRFYRRLGFGEHTVTLELGLRPPHPGGRGDTGPGQP